MSVSIGIDIGTTSICGVVVDNEKGNILKSKTLSNGSFIKSDLSFEKAQSPEIILDTALALLNDFLLEFSDTKAIGLTGQMHGILYLDSEGRAVSPLYTWQDERGNELMGDKTYCEEFSRITGYKTAAGYGLVTHFYNLKNGLVPLEAVKLCTIHDYIAMRLAGLNSPVVHISDAASLGCYSFEGMNFDLDAIKKTGINTDFLPKVSADFEIVGSFKGVPVSLAIGDNQASFIGTTVTEDTLLFNAGTGSQVSMITDVRTAPENTELRPLYKDKCILVGSSLCGGRAYAALKSFFEIVGKELFGSENKNLYAAMDKLALSGLSSCTLNVSTLFCGTRSDPTLRGSVTNLGLENFTPEQLISGVIFGMTDELKAMYDAMVKVSGKKITGLVGSGNGIRFNLPLQQAVKSRFGFDLKIPKNTEEAAFGSVIFAITAIGEYEDVMQAAKALIKYN